MTDTKLQELIDTLKRQGVESGEEASRQIIENARKEAGEIVAKAKSEAQAIVAKAEEEASRQLRQLQSSMEIAATQLITNLKRTIEENLLIVPLRKELAQNLSDTEFLKSLILTCVREYAKAPGRTDLEIVVSKEQLERLDNFAAEGLRSHSADGGAGESALNLRTGEVSFGFLVGRTDNAVRLDFTDQAFLELFLRYISPRFREFFKTIDLKELGRK